MNIRLLLFSVGLLVADIHDAYANNITLRDKQGNNVDYDTEDNDLLVLPYSNIDDAVIYGFVVDTPGTNQPVLKLINKCDWRNCMKKCDTSKSRWMSRSMLPAGCIVKGVHVYKKLEDGSYRLRRTIDVTSRQQRNLILPVRLRDVLVIDQNEENRLVERRVYTAEEVAPFDQLFSPEPTRAQRHESDRRLLRLYRQIMREDARNNGIHSNNLPQNNDSESDSEREPDGNYSYDNER